MFVQAALGLRRLVRSMAKRRHKSRLPTGRHTLVSRHEGWDAAERSMIICSLAGRKPSDKSRAFRGFWPGRTGAFSRQSGEGLCNCKLFATRLSTRDRIATVPAGDARANEVDGCR